MDEMPSSVQKNSRRRHKHTKNPTRKQQQLKIVYISNPVRVNTSAAKFRALVQELTGQDADDMPPPRPPQPVFPAAHDAASAAACSWQKDVVGEGGGGIGTACVAAMEDQVVLKVPSIHHHPGTGTSSSENSNPIFEDAYVPQLQECLPAGILPSNIWYESI